MTSQMDLDQEENIITQLENLEITIKNKAIIIDDLEEQKIRDKPENFIVLKITDISAKNENKNDIAFSMVLMDTEQEGFKWETTLSSETAMKIRYFTDCLQTYAAKQKEEEEQRITNIPEAIPITEAKLEGAHLTVKGVTADVMKKSSTAIREHLEKALKVKINNVQKPESKGNAEMDYVFINLNPDEADKIANREVAHMEIDYRADYGDRDVARTVLLRTSGNHGFNKEDRDQIRNIIIKGIEEQTDQLISKSKVLVFPGKSNNQFWGVVNTTRKFFAQQIKNLEIKENGLEIEFYMTGKRIPKSYTEITISNVPRKITATQDENSVIQEIQNKTGIKPAYLDFDKSKGLIYIGTFTAEESDKIKRQLKQINDTNVKIQNTIDYNESMERQPDQIQLKSKETNTGMEIVNEFRTTTNLLIETVRRSIEQTDRLLAIQEKQIAIQAERDKSNDERFNQLMTLMTSQIERDQKRSEIEQEKERAREEMQKKLDDKINKVMETLSINPDQRTTKKRTREDDEGEDKQSKQPRVASSINKPSLYPRTTIIMTLFLLISQVQASNTNALEEKHITISAVNVMCLSSLIIINKLVRWIQDYEPDIIILTEHKIRRIHGTVTPINIPGYEWRSISAKSKRIRKRPNSARGGVAILTKPSIITVDPKNTDENEITEGRYCELSVVTQENERIRIIGVYGPADQREQPQFLNQITKIVKENENRIIIGGDFNNLISKKDATHNTHHKIKHMQLFRDKCQLEEHDENDNIKERATFMRKNYASKLDYILTNFRDGVVTCKTINVEIADHLPVVLTISPKLITGNVEAQQFKERIKIDRRDKKKLHEYQRMISNWCYQNEETIEEFKTDKKDKGEHLYEQFNEIITTTAKRIYAQTKRSIKKTTRTFPYDSKGGRLIGRISWINRAIKRMKFIQATNPINITNEDRKIFEPNELTEDIAELKPGDINHADIDRYLKELINKKNRTNKKLNKEIKAFREQRTKEWQDLIKNEGHANSSKIRSILNRAQNVQLRAITTNDGELITNPDNVKESIADYFEQQRQNIQPRNVTKPWLHDDIWKETRAQIAQYNSNQKLEADITVDELTNHIRERPNGKASGIDEVTYEMIKILPKEGIELYTNILNAIVNEKLSPKNFKSAEIVLIYKRDNQYSPKNYRPITLLEIAYKVITGVIAERISIMNQQIQFITPCQFGGIANTSCGEATQVIINIIKKAHRQQDELHIGCHDISGAYDNEPNEAVIDTFRSLGLPNKMIETIIFMQDKLINKVRTVYGHSRDIIFNKGIPQGDPFSVLKFVLFMDMFTRWMISKQRGYEVNNIHIPGLQWIDDSNFIARSNEELQTMTNELVQFLDAYQMKLSPHKSSYMAFNNNNDDVINVDQTEIKPSNTMRFLGYHIDKYVNWSEHERIMKYAMKNSMKRITKHNIPAETKLNLINSDTISIYRFSADLVPYSKSFNKEIIRAIKNKADPTNAYRIATSMYFLDKKLFAHHIEDLEAINKGRMVSNLMKCLNNKNIFVRLTTENTITDMNKDYKTQVLNGRNIRNDNKSKKYPPNIVNAIKTLHELDIKIFINKAPTKEIEDLTIEEYFNEIKLTKEQEKTLETELKGRKNEKMKKICSLFKRNGREHAPIYDLITCRPINYHYETTFKLPIDRQRAILPIFNQVYETAHARLERYTERMQHNVPLNNLIWATDGSKRGEIATTAVVSDKATYKHRVPEQQSIARAEAYGIQICLEKNLINNGNINIISDSKTTLQIIEKYRRTRKEKIINKNDNASIIRRIVEIMDQVNVSLRHIKAHTGNQDELSKLNEKADKAAKETNEREQRAPINWKHLPMYIPLIKNELFEGNISKIIRIDSQNQRMKKEATIASIRTATSEQVWKIPSFFSTGRNQDRLNFAIQCNAKALPTMSLLSTRCAELYDSRLCPACGKEDEDQEHVMLRCEKYHEIREELKQQIKDEMNIPNDRYLWLAPTQENRFFPEQLACRGAIPIHLERVITLRKAKRINNIIIQSFNQIWNERNKIIVEKGLTHVEQKARKLEEQFNNIEQEEEEQRKAIEQLYFNEF